MKPNSLKPSPTSMLDLRSARFTVALGFLLSIFCFLLFVGSASAATFYVCQTSPSPGPPYDTWANAAHDIQTAVDAALAGDEILVTNGVYATGGRAVGTNVLVNRVAVDKPLIVRSVNGPEFTIIEGAKAPGGGNGDGAVRCVYLADEASLSGFTLTNGATRTAGDWEREQCGGGALCAATNAVLTNCVLCGNSACGGGGGEYGGTLNNCTLTGNSASYGSGVYFGTLNGCTLTANSAVYEGGGAFYGTLNNCTLTGNSASGGGGASGGTLNQCRLAGNSASEGGGAAGSTLNSCTLTGNSADSYGGAAAWSTLNHCTLTGNSSFWEGGGAYGGTLNNCILYFNTARNGANYFTGANHLGWEITTLLNYCCTTPMPRGGLGNITDDPQLLSATYLSANSPCLGAGSATYAAGTDIDGENWRTSPSIGCDEYYAGGITGPLEVMISADYTIVTTGFAVNFNAAIIGHPTASVWEFGDGTAASNRLCTPHAWTASGDYAVALRAYNESHPTGVGATVMVHVVEKRLHYVAIDSAGSLAPYTSWATAATNIQDAVDAAAAGGIVLVSSGVYAVGGRAVGTNELVNRVAVEKPLTVRSVNGPEFTIIQGAKAPGGTNGDGAIRCVYLAGGASLSGFTLTNGATRTEGDLQRDCCGGGAWCAWTNSILTNCLLSRNSAGEGDGTYYFTGSFGGGAYGGTLYGCTLIANLAGSGGGADWCTLYNCTLIGNTAADGGGVGHGALYNCVLTGNSAWNGGGAYRSTLYNCTLSGNWTTYEGGGASRCTLYNCVLTGNSANEGGGVWNGRLVNCLLIGNSAFEGGGAFGFVSLPWASGCWLDNCTVTGNSAEYRGGGVSGRAIMGGGQNGCYLSNCIVYFNTSGLEQENCGPATLHCCCTTPTPWSGSGNITNAPLFVNTNNWSDLRLLPNSPCIDAGTNLTELLATDRLGLPRPMDGDGDGIARFDIGAYEFNPYRFEPALHLSGDGFWFTVRGEPGRSARIERSRDLVNWEYAGEVPIPACGQTLIDPAATTEPRLFYRAIRVP